jgi:hypothetical protein
MRHMGHARQKQVYQGANYQKEAYHSHQEVKCQTSGIKLHASMDGATESSWVT